MLDNSDTNLPPLTDTQLVRLAQTGHKEAFDSLVERHFPRLLRWMTSLLWDDDEARNLAQEAVTRAYTGLQGFNSDQSFPAWLNGIGLNLCRHHLRTKSRHAISIDPLQLEQMVRADQRSVLSGIVSREQMNKALAAIEELPMALREAFVLHIIEHFPYDEMSSLTGISEGTLRVRVHRAKSLLRSTLGPIVDTWLLQVKSISR